MPAFLPTGHDHTKLLIARDRTLVEPGSDLILPDVRAHLAEIAALGPEAIVFTSPAGKLLRHGNFRRGIWLPALATTGLTGVHFHDLRHAGHHMVASAGASLRELMERMGHSSPRAALIYQPSTDERQRILAESVARQAEAALDARTRGTYGHARLSCGFDGRPERDSNARPTA